jgi:hypothetical protein
VTFTDILTDATLIAEAKIADAISAPVTKEATVPTIAVTMDFHSSGTGVAFGKVAEHEDLLDVAWDIKYKDNVISDFVVEQNTYGIWTYRKWNSGIAECWGRANIYSVAAWSNTVAYCYAKLPFTFVEPPIVASSGGQAGLAGSYITYTESTTTGIDSYMQCTVEPSAGSYCWFDFQVKGRWK